MVVADHGQNQISHGDDHGHHEDPPQLQHHFETPEQQFESSKLGMWLFLATELLLFGGLFCAYVINRTHHPEIFLYAHQFLDTQMGAINTAVLIFSSFTMAWAVRASQLDQQKLMTILLSITVFCGFLFMGIKYVEYTSKFEYGIKWGTQFSHEGMEKYLASHHGGHGEEGAHGSHADDTHAEASHEDAQETAGEGDHHDEQNTDAATSSATGNGAESQSGSGAESTQTAEQIDASAVDQTTVAEAAQAGDPIEYSQHPTAAIGPTGIAEQKQSAQPASYGVPEGKSYPDNVHVFFGIYYTMTGLHAIHVIVGMIAISWLIWKSMKGQFGSQYYTPVDLVGLYWHVVDLIWIFLFPLLYLIE